jgi:hypothetical protein
MFREAERGLLSQKEMCLRDGHLKPFDIHWGPGKPSLIGCHGPRPEICSLLLIFRP